MRVLVGARTPGDPLFPSLGISASKSSEAALFFPRGEAASTSPLRLSPVRMHSVWGSDFSSFPLSFPEGILLSTRSSILAMLGSGEPSGSGAGHLILSALLSHSWPRMIFRINNYDKYKTRCPVSRLLTWVSRRLQLRPASSVVSGHFTCGPKNNLHIPSSFRPKKCLIVRGPSGLNSHIQRGRRLHGSVRRISITCIMLTRFMSLSISSQIQFYSSGTSPSGP